MNFKAILIWFERRELKLIPNISRKNTVRTNPLLLNGTRILLLIILNENLWFLNWNKNVFSRKVWPPGKKQQQVPRTEPENCNKSNHMFTGKARKFRPLTQKITGKQQYLWTKIYLQIRKYYTEISFKTTYPLKPGSNDIESWR